MSAPSWARTKLLESQKNKTRSSNSSSNSSTVMLNLLVCAQEGADIDIEHIMSYPLTPVPYSLGTARNS